MKRIFSRRRLLCGLLPVLLAPVLFGCSEGRGKREANAQNFTAATKYFLEQRGHLCLAKYNWPIFVTSEDSANKTRDSTQMPVLESLGLVKARTTVIERSDQHGNQVAAHAVQYDLTPEGNRSYLHFPIVVATPGKRVAYEADLCAATLSLDRVVGWEPPIDQDGETRTSVLYTYKILPTNWARDRRVLTVFPAIARAMEGEGKMQLREGMHLAPDGWVADEIDLR